MDEWVDILNEDGTPTGEKMLKSEAHKKGLFHPTVHVWLYTSDGRILFQKRGMVKKTFPGLWDVSVSGHVSAGEAIVEAALRETAEEVGLSLRESDLHKVGIYKSRHYHGEDIRDFEFHHCFIAELKVPISELTKENEEVEEIKLIPLFQFADELWGLGNPAIYVPHRSGYLQAVIREINKALKSSNESGDLA